MENEKILSELFIPKEWWDKCYIADNGQVYTPIFDLNGNITKTGEEYYNSCTIPAQ